MKEIEGGRRNPQVTKLSWEEAWILSLRWKVMEYYSAIKSNNFMKFIGKWIELENIILSEITQPPPKKTTWYALTDKWILAQKLE